MTSTDLVSNPQLPRFKPIYFLAFSGDLLCSLLIVSCVLVGTKLGVENWVIGILGSSYGMSYMFSAAIFGHVSDKIGRRRSLLVTSVGFTVIAMLFLAMPGNIPVLIVGQMAIGLLYGFWWCSIEAYISENTTNADHQQKVNNFCISWSLGYMMGPFLGPLLSIIGSVYSFSILLVFSVVNIGMISVFIQSHTNKVNPAINTSSAPLDDTNRTGIKNLALASAILVLTIFTYAFTKSFFIGLFPDIAISDIGFTEVETSILGLAFGLARTCSFIIQKRMKNDSILVRVMLAISLSSTCFLFATTSNFTLYIVFISIMGMFSGLVYTTTLELLLQINKKAKGRVAGYFEASIGIGTFISPILGSAVLGTSYLLAYIVVASVSTAIACGGLLICLMLRQREKKDN